MVVTKLSFSDQNMSKSDMEVTHQVVNCLSLVDPLFTSDYTFMVMVETSLIKTDIRVKG